MRRGPLLLAQGDYNFNNLHSSPESKVSGFNPKPASNLNLSVPSGSKYLILIYLPKACTITTITPIPSTKMILGTWTLNPKPYILLYTSLYIPYISPLKGLYYWVDGPSGVAQVAQMDPGGLPRGTQLRATPHGLGTQNLDL